MHRHHDDAQLGIACAESPCHLDAVGTARERHVHQDHGRTELLDEPERLVPVAGLADDVDAGELQRDAHRFAQHDVIVDDQDARPAVHIASIRRGLPWAIMGHGGAATSTA